MNPDNIKFWQTEGVYHVGRVKGPEFWEGPDAVNAIVNLVGTPTSLRDISCGYGRYAKLFDSNAYVGYDMCESAVTKARQLRPGYKFAHWDLSYLPHADVTLFACAATIVHDDDIVEVVKLLTTNTNVVVFATQVGREFRSRQDADFYLYYRDIEEYDELFAHQGFNREDQHIFNVVKSNQFPRFCVTKYAKA